LSCRALLGPVEDKKADPREQDSTVLTGGEAEVAGVVPAEKIEEKAHGRVGKGEQADEEAGRARLALA